jgi:hypothetical protein
MKKVNIFILVSVHYFFLSFFFSSGKLMFDPFFVYEMPIYMAKTSKILTFKGTPNPVIFSFGEKKEVQQKCFSKKKLTFSTSTAPVRPSHVLTFCSRKLPPLMALKVDL